MIDVLLHKLSRCIILMIYTYLLLLIARLTPERNSKRFIWLKKQHDKIDNELNELDK